MIPAATDSAFLLVLDRAWEDFAQAGEALERLCNSFAAEEVAGIDLFAHPPSTLACLLRFASSDTALEAAPSITLEAGRGGWRVLDVSRLTQLERMHFFERMLPRFAFRESGSGSPYKPLERLLEALALAAPAPTPATTMLARGAPGAFDLAAPLSVTSTRTSFAGFGRDLSTAGAWVEAPVCPELNEELLLTFGTEAGQEPLRVRARVREIIDASAAEPRGRKPGFYADFLLQQGDRDPLEAFLLALQSGRRWPERSGRRYERFPLRLCAEYDYEGAHRIETTGNLSRGGLFLLSAHPPALGAEIRLKLTAFGKKAAIELDGVVVHVTSMEGAPRSDPGAGVRFTEPPEVVRARLTQLLGDRDERRPLKAMIVDDDRFFRRMLGSELQRAGYEVMEAESAEAAFGLLLTQLLRLDVLILDVYLPGMRGDDLLRRINEVGRDPDLGVAVLTGGELADEAVESFLSLGADVVLTKRHAPDQILRSLAAAVRRSRA